jgi:alkyl sulfatase BDS1-like metallo-beta-lactamase superfamily hydrolase
MMGGADAVVAKAHDFFARGDYRWTIEMLNNVVFAEPEHAGARTLLADAYEQLGYQCENGVWRNFYLTSAAELRGELPPPPPANIDMQVLGAMPLSAMFDLFAVRLAGPEAAARDTAVRVDIANEGKYLLQIRSGVLTWRESTSDAAVDASIKLDRVGLLMVGFGGNEGVGGLIEGGTISVDGDISAVEHLAGSLVRFERGFGISAP